MNNLTVTEYKNIRVLTTQQIAEAYGTDKKVISYNFNHNKDRYIEGKHYLKLEGVEKTEFINRLENHDGSKNAKTLYLWTEKGAFLHAKSLNTDKAWEVYDRLVDEYFEKPKLPLWTMDDKIQILAQGNIELKEKIDAVNDDLQEFKRDASLSTIFIVNIRFCANSKIPFSNSWFFKIVYFNSTSIPLIFSSPFTGITRDGTPFISFSSIRAILSGWMQIVASGVTIFTVFEL